MNDSKITERIAPDNLTPAQAAQFLNIPVATLAIWRSTGRVHLPFAKLGGKHVRYRRSDLEAFLTGSMRGGPAAQ
jgi:excisionase family DNA binding protein